MKNFFIYKYLILLKLEKKASNKDRNLVFNDLKCFRLN